MILRYIPYTIFDRFKHYILRAMFDLASQMYMFAIIQKSALIFINNLIFNILNEIYLSNRMSNEVAFKVADLLNEMIRKMVKSA